MLMQAHMAAHAEDDEASSVAATHALHPALCTRVLAALKQLWEVRLAQPAWHMCSTSLSSAGMLPPLLMSSILSSQGIHLPCSLW